jgi:preprotein translocase subunit SecA
VPAILDKILRIGEGKILRQLETISEAVNAIEDDFIAMSDAELRGMSDQFRARLEDGETLDDIMPEAFATVREAAKRVIGQRHFDVQVMGGAALHLGNIAEMKTGEGKTLVATLPAYLNALAGKGVHIVTVNDYLARYHAEWMGRIHHFLGLTTGVILPQMKPAERREAYACDITYGTNNELGFDYLRDNMASALEDCVQRGHNFAIVDEVDSILIDEARTPLIISGPTQDEVRWYGEFAKIATTLQRDVDYEVDEKKRTISVLEPGITKVEDHLGIVNLYDSVNTPLISFMHNSIKAKELFHNDKEYVVMNGEVLIVDEHTGRILAGRRYNDGLHQSIEAKEEVEVREEYQTLATITLQNYFRLYDKLSGMTGTALTEATEFMKIYEIAVIEVPTHRPMIRADHNDQIYKTKKGKWVSVVDELKERNEKGQPVLVGTISVEVSEMLADELRRAGVEHVVLNAKPEHAQREGEIVAQAGRLGAVTIATNMAGRGVDIKLGGDPDMLAQGELRKLGITPENESWEQELEELRPRFKEQCAEEGEKVKALGGLFICGTERHESRRIDNQLRGRSGRQGDPGESRFFLSAEDDLIRLFAGERIYKILDRLGPVDEEGKEYPLEAKMLTRTIENAQKKVEQQNFLIRKRVLEYDDVMNEQRRVIYKYRREILEGRDMSDVSEQELTDVVVRTVETYTPGEIFEDWDLAGLQAHAATLWPLQVSLSELEPQTSNREEIVAKLTEDALAAYDRREEEFGSELMRYLERQILLQIIDNRWREHLYEMDYLREGIHLRGFAQIDPLVAYKNEGFKMFEELMASIWEEFVRVIFHVEVNIEPAQAEQLFGREEEPREVQYAGGPAAEQPSAIRQARAAGAGAAAPAAAVAGAGNGAAQAEGGVNPATVVKTDQEKIGRNDPCWCGSGKKYKKCHGA